MTLPKGAISPTSFPMPPLPTSSLERKYCELKVCETFWLILNPTFWTEIQLTCQPDWLWRCRAEQRGRVPAREMRLVGKRSSPGTCFPLSSLPLTHSRYNLFFCRTSAQNLDLIWAIVKGSRWDLNRTEWWFYMTSSPDWTVASAFSGKPL